MRLQLLWLAAVTLSSGAGAIDIDGRYSLDADTAVHAESSAGTFDRTVSSTIDVSVGHGDKSVTLDVHHDAYVCRIQGLLSGSTVTFPEGQKCPQSIKESGFRAQLEGTLASGVATFSGTTMKLTTNWNVRGTVMIGPLTIPVSGTLLTTAAGARS